MGGRPSPIAGAAVTLSAAVVVLTGCSGTDDPVVVSGRAIGVTDNPHAPRVQRVELFHWPYQGASDSPVAEADVGADGTFSIRAQRTDDMKQAQSTNGTVRFVIRGFWAGGEGFCESFLGLSVRFENGRWVEADTRQRGVVGFRGVGSCQKVSLPFGLPD
jgi:hypothetical protein